MRGEPDITRGSFAQIGQDVSLRIAEGGEVFGASQAPVSANSTTEEEAL